ncbi:protein FAM185A [Engraulis encrasicolus]|uniref:protein FAM185A n=1 Tax=Engraulis encrasicolus TaxID=184585 RepID=UPI002FD142C0
MYWAALGTRVCVRAVWLGTKELSRVGFALPLTGRRLSVKASLHNDLGKPLKQWEFEVSPFSKVNVKLPCDLSVRPLDPHAFPEADRAFISVQGVNVNSDINLDDFKVQYCAESEELLIHGDDMTSNVTVELTAPIKSDIYVTATGEGSVSIQRMESDVCKVQTEKGNCTLASIRSHCVDVQAAGGNVTGLGTIHGNVTICGKEGSEVNLKKIQGSYMIVSTDQGQLKVKSIYAESSQVSSSAGEIQLGHIHGDAIVETDSGNVNVDTSNGALNIMTVSGNIDAYVGEKGSADLVTETGSVSVRIPASMKAGLHLSGVAVNISPDVPLQDAQQDTTDRGTTVIGNLNGESTGGPRLQTSVGEQRITASAGKGTISLRAQSWFETLKLGM